MSNNTGFRHAAGHLHTRFKKLYKRRAHLHHYLEWMEESEFSNAQEKIESIITGYSEIESR